MAIVEGSPKVANEPRVPAGPRPTPALASVDAEAKMRSSALMWVRPRSEASSASTAVPSTKTGQVDEHERDHGQQRLLVDDGHVEAHGAHELGVNGAHDLASEQAGEHEVPDDLDRAGRGSRAPADEEQQRERHQSEQGPLAVVDGEVAGRRDHRGHLEDPGAHGGLPVLGSVRPHARGDDRARDDGDGEVEAQLLVAQRLAGAALDQRAVQHEEVCGGDHHEDDDRPLGQRAERADRAALGREAAGAQGAEVCANAW
jgi:hypothetical protein